MSSELKQYLEELGLSEYESRVYLALLSLCSGTMRELAENPTFHIRRFMR